MFTDVEASKSSVTVIIGPPVFEDVFIEPDPSSRFAGAWNEVLRVCGVLEWPFNLTVCAPKGDTDWTESLKGRHPLLVTALRLALHAADHFITCGVRPLTPFVAAAGAGRCAMTSARPAWQRALLLPLAVVVGALVGVTTGAGMLLWNTLAGVALLLSTALTLAAAAGTIVAAGIAVAVFGLAVAVGGGIAYGAAYAAKAGAGRAMTARDVQAEGVDTAPESVAAAETAAEAQERLAGVFSRPWAPPLRPFGGCSPGNGSCSAPKPSKLVRSLRTAGNHLATAAARLTSPAVLPFGLAKCVWDTWPVVFIPVGVLLSAVVGIVLGVGIGGCGIICNMCEAMAALVAASWHTAQQGIASLMVGRTRSQSVSPAGQQHKFQDVEGDVSDISSEVI